MNRCLVALAASVLLLAGCAGRTGAATPSPHPDGGQESSATTDGGFNRTDVGYLQMMVPHHAQGLRIVRLAKHRALRPDVKRLAGAIETTQRAELEQMSRWLRYWEQAAAAPADSHTHHAPVPGTSAAEIDTVRRAPDAEFERRFLNLLIAHQDDAIQIARMQTADGVYRPARELARRIDASRSAQIKQMLAWWAKAEAAHPAGTSAKSPKSW